MRVAAWSQACTRMIEGVPGLLLNRAGCPTLHKGLMGAWHYKRLAISGEERFQDVPSKNDVSHICDGGGYGLMGAGEFRASGGRNLIASAAPIVADGAWDVFG